MTLRTRLGSVGAATSTTAQIREEGVIWNGKLFRGIQSLA